MNRDDWRHANACIRCYSHKLKCRRPPTQLTCLRCAKLQVQCIPRVPKRHRDSSSFPSPVTTTANELSNGLPQTLAHSPCGSSTEIQPGPYNEDFAPDLSRMSDICEDVDIQSWTDRFLADLNQDTNALRYNDKDMCTELATMSTVAENATSRSTSNAKDLTARDLPSIAISSEQQSSKMYWVEDLSQISMQLLTFSTSGSASPSNNTNHTGHTSSRVEHSFTLATKLLAVMKLMTRSSAVLLQAGPHYMLESTASGDSLPPKSSPRSRKEGYMSLEEQSDGLQLMSSYMRLLSIFNSHLDHLERHLLQLSARPEADAFSKSSLSYTPDQVVAQDFIVVNMIEFHLRRVGSVLRELSQRDDAAYQFEADTGSHGRGESAYGNGKGINSVSAVIYEQQAILLRRVCQIRSELMAA